MYSAALDRRPLIQTWEIQTTGLNLSDPDVKPPTFVLNSPLFHLSHDPLKFELRSDPVRWIPFRTYLDRCPSSPETSWELLEVLNDAVRYVPSLDAPLLQDVQSMRIMFKEKYCPVYTLSNRIRIIWWLPHLIDYQFQVGKSRVSADFIIVKITKQIS